MKKILFTAERAHFWLDLNDIVTINSERYQQYTATYLVLKYRPYATILGRPEPRYSMVDILEFLESDKEITTVKAISVSVDEAGKRVSVDVGDWVARVMG